MALALRANEEIVVRFTTKAPFPTERLILERAAVPVFVMVTVHETVPFRLSVHPEGTLPASLSSGKRMTPKLIVCEGETVKP